MKCKTNRFTFIIAAIFIAAICVFPIFAGGGANAHAAAPAYEPEQPATQCIATVSAQTYSSLGVTLTDSEVEKLKTAFGNDFSIYTGRPSDLISERTIATNNINGTQLTGVLAIKSEGGMPMPITTVNIVLPKINVFKDLPRHGYSNVVLKRNGEAVKSNPSLSAVLSDDFYVYSMALSSTAILGSEFTVEYELVEVEKPIPLPPDPTKEGYTFIGWYLDAEFTQRYDGRPIYEDTTLYARFEINRYTVTFNSDGGSNVETQTVEWNTAASITTPTRAGYNFLGWFYEDGTEYTGQKIKENTTLIARWQIKTFTVTFYVDGEVYSVKEVEYGTQFVQVVEEAKTEYLELLAVLDGESEKKISKYMETEITGDYCVKAKLLRAIPTEAQIFFGKYPWIFAVGGAALSLVVAGISIAGYFAQKHNRVQSTGRKKR